MIKTIKAASAAQTQAITLKQIKDSLGLSTLAGFDIDITANVEFPANTNTSAYENLAVTIASDATDTSNVVYVEPKRVIINNSPLKFAAQYHFDSDPVIDASDAADGSDTTVIGVTAAAATGIIATTLVCRADRMYLGEQPTTTGKDEAQAQFECGDENRTTADQARLKALSPLGKINRTKVKQAAAGFSWDNKFPTLYDPVTGAAVPDTAALLSRTGGIRKEFTDLADDNLARVMFRQAAGGRQKATSNTESFSEWQKQTYMPRQQAAPYASAQIAKEIFDAYDTTERHSFADGQNIPNGAIDVANRDFDVRTHENILPTTTNGDQTFSQGQVESHQAQANETGVTP